MAIDPHDRKAFLLALLIYARESKNFNPHFHVGEMLTRLSVDRGTFNILEHSLGPQYCRFVDTHQGEDRYAIDLANCLDLKDKYDCEAAEERRSGLNLRVALLVAVLSALLGAALAKWL